MMTPPCTEQRKQTWSISAIERGNANTEGASQGSPGGTRECVMEEGESTQSRKEWVGGILAKKVGKGGLGEGTA